MNFTPRVGALVAPLMYAQLRYLLYIFIVRLITLSVSFREVPPDPETY